MISIQAGQCLLHDHGEAGIWRWVAVFLLGGVFERTVFLEKNFKLGPAPKHHVYPVPKASIRSSGDVTGSMFVGLGHNFEGSQK